MLQTSATQWIRLCVCVCGLLLLLFVNVLTSLLSLGADTVDSSAADQMYQQISEEPKVKKLYLRGSVQQ